MIRIQFQLDNMLTLEFLVFILSNKWTFSTLGVAMCSIPEKIQFAELSLLLMRLQSGPSLNSHLEPVSQLAYIYYIGYIDPAYIATIYHNIYWYTCKDVFSILLLGAVIIIAINSPKICYNITIISTLAHITANQLGNAESKGTLNYDKAHIILQRSNGLFWI